MSFGYKGAYCTEVGAEVSGQDRRSDCGARLRWIPRQTVEARGNNGVKTLEYSVVQNGSMAGPNIGISGGGGREEFGMSR